jgi:hypothetical protein
MGFETKILWMTSWGVYTTRKKFETKKVVIDQSVATLQVSRNLSSVHSRKKEQEGEMKGISYCAKSLVTGISKRPVKDNCTDL